MARSFFRAHPSTSILLFGLLSAVPGCVGADGEAEPDDVGDAPVTAPSPAANARPSFPREAVIGVIRQLEGGKEIWSDSRSAPVPDNLAELLDTGKADAEGNVYFDKSGAYSEDGRVETRYQYIVKQPLARIAKAELDIKSSGPPAPPPKPRAKTSPDLDALLASGSTEPVMLYIRLKQGLQTSIRSNAALGLASLAGAEKQLEERRSKLLARKDEARASQAPLVSRLEELGADQIGGYWTSNAVSARVPIEAVPELLAHPDVEQVSLPARGVDNDATNWDGLDMKASGGLNTGIYMTNGFNGQAFANNTGGRKIRVAVVGGGFLSTHPGFIDYPGGPSRVHNWDCTGASCVAGSTAAQPHATKVAGLAVGGLQQGQMGSNTDDWEIQRSGVAEEVDVHLISITLDSATMKRAIELAVDQGVDVLVSSTGFGSTQCDGVMESDLNQTAYNAQLAGMLIVQSAGNGYDQSGTCTITGLAEAPSVFAAAGVANSQSQCTSANYASCPISSFSDRGGMNATVNGVLRAGAITQIGAATDACPLYYFDVNGGISTSSACGTSYSSPQIGGAGALVKDWFLDQGYTSITVEGRLHTVLLAMTDRANDTSSYRTSGFDPRWGAGRFQTRFFNGTDLGGPWGWETYSHVLSNGSQVDSVVQSTALEPSTLAQFNAYAVVFEQDTNDIADVDLSILDNNCGSGAATLGSDTSYDTRSMVRLGSSAAGKALCTRVKGYHVPSGETRRVHVFDYYSGGTSMR